MGLLVCISATCQINKALNSATTYPSHSSDPTYLSSEDVRLECARLAYKHPGIGVGVSAPGARLKKIFALILSKLA